MEKRRKCNKYDLTGEYGIGWTSNTNDEFYFDLEDYDKIKDYTWMKSVKHTTDSSEYYSLRTTVDQKWVMFHQIITGEKYVDHINRNTLDNRKINLRNTTQQNNTKNHSINSNNTSGIIGVSYHKTTGKWMARINYDKYKRKYVYYGHSFEEAVKARLTAEKEYYGEFAPQKHLYEQYGIE